MNLGGYVVPARRAFTVYVGAAIILCKIYICMVYLCECEIALFMLIRFTRGLTFDINTHMKWFHVAGGL